MAGYVHAKQVASNHFDGCDKLLNAFHEIGSCIPQFHDIADIFQGSDTIANYLALFYAEIIEFHYQAMRFFRRTGITSWMFRILIAYVDGSGIGWKMLLKSMWPKDTFGTIKQNIEKHGSLIQEGRDFRELERNILSNVQSQHCAETGKWIFSDPLFRSWLSAGNGAKQRLLWLTGVPGAGDLNLSVTIDLVVADHYI